MHGKAACDLRQLGVQRCVATLKQESGSDFADSRHNFIVKIAAQHLALRGVPLRFVHTRQLAVLLCLADCVLDTLLHGLRWLVWVKALRQGHILNYFVQHSLVTGLRHADSERLR